MKEKYKIFVIIGSAGKNSANEQLVNNFGSFTKDLFSLTVLKDLKTLPHFDPELSTGNPPREIIGLRNDIEKSDGILICTPEYIFSVPAGLKNAIEWCVSTTVFSNKPVALITASASGREGHQQLQLLMKTVSAKFTPETTLLIQGIKGKINEEGQITDDETREQLLRFIDAFKTSIITNEEESFDFLRQPPR
jgi:NAD(P)H-dependent FMN reductase